METGHPSTQAINSRNGNRALGLDKMLSFYLHYRFTIIPVVVVVIVVVVVVVVVVTGAPREVHVMCMH